MKISVIIPTINRPSMLLNAVNSVNSQKFLNKEIIIVNDAEKSIGNIFLHIPNVTVIESNLGKGPGFCRSIGCKHASGDYITFLDDDDIMLPNYLERLHNEILNSVDKSCFYWSSVKVLDRVSESCVSQFDIKFPIEYDSFSDLVVTALRIGTGYGLTCAREALKDIGYFNPKYRYIEDTELVVRLLKNNIHPVPINQIYIEVNKHSINQLTSSKFNEKRIKECHKLLCEQSDFFDKFPSAKAQLNRQILRLENEVM